MMTVKEMEVVKVEKKPGGLGTEMYVTLRGTDREALMSTAAKRLALEKAMEEGMANGAIAGFPTLKPVDIDGSPITEPGKVFAAFEVTYRIQ